MEQEKPSFRRAPGEGLLEMAIRWFSGHDVFISYARDDGATYAAGLAGELAGQGLACRLDQGGSLPGKEPHPELMREVRRSMIFVLIATGKAGESTPVETEIKEFLKTGRWIIPVDVDGSIEKAKWWPLVRGLHRSTESKRAAEALTTGHPSPEVVNRIARSFEFSRRDQRLRWATRATIVVLVLFLLMSLVAGAIARSQLLRAREVGQIASSRTLLSEAELAKARPDPFVRPLRLALEAWRQHPSREPDALLRHGLDRLPRKVAEFSHPAPIEAVAFSLEEQRISTLGQDLTARVWDITAGREITSVRLDHSKASALSPDGRFVMAAGLQKADGGSEVRLVELATGKECGTWTHAGEFQSLAFNEAGNRLASSSWAPPHGEVQIRELDPEMPSCASLRPVAVIPLSGAPETLTFSGNGEYILIEAFEDNALRSIWRINPLQKVHKIDTGILALNDDGQYLGVRKNQDARVEQIPWHGDLEEASEAEPVVSLTELDEGYTAMAFSSEGSEWDGSDTLFFIADTLNTVRIINLNEGGRERAQLRHEKSIDEIRSSRRSLLTITSDNVVHLWDIRHRQLYESLRIFHKGEITAHAMSRNDRYVATASNGMVRVWEKTPHGAMSSLRLDSGIHGKAASSNGGFLAAAYPNGYEPLGWVWDTVKRQPRVFSATAISESLSSSYEACLSNDGRYLFIGASSPANALHVWDLHTERSVARLDSRLWDCSDDGRFMVTTRKNEEKQLELWESFKKVWEASLPTVPTGLSLSPGGGLLAIADGSQTVQLVRTRSRQGKKLQHAAPVQSVSFGPVGEHLVVLCSDHSVVLWTRTGEKLKELGPFPDLWMVKLSPDERHLVVGTPDGRVRLFETASGRRAGIEWRLQGPVEAFAFTRDGSHLAVGTRRDDISEGAGDLHILELSGNKTATRLELDRYIQSLDFTAEDRELLVVTETLVAQLPWRAEDMQREAWSRFVETVRSISPSAPDS